MKKKKLSKGLTLNKSTITSFKNMNGVKGGITDRDCTDRCQTFDLSNCQTWEFPICNPCTDYSRFYACP